MAKILVAWPVIFVSAVVLHTLAEAVLGIDVTVFWWVLIDLVLLPVSAVLALAMVEREHARPGRAKRGFTFWALVVSLTVIASWVVARIAPR